MYEVGPSAALRRDDMDKKVGNRRRAITKKIRFEVFKRDSFICQYCGRRAPDVILNVDHIVPVSDGGDNNIMNLVTSCFECNSGKGSRRLGDTAEVAKAHNQLEQLQERRNQLEMMRRWAGELADISKLEDDVCIEAFNKRIPGRTLNDVGIESIRQVRIRFGTALMLQAIAIAGDYYIKTTNGLPTRESVNDAIDKLGGICYNISRRAANPDLEDEDRVVYVIAKKFDIPRNKVRASVRSWVAGAGTNDGRRSAIEELLDIAHRHTYWNSFIREVQ